MLVQSWEFEICHEALQFHVMISNVKPDVFYFVFLSYGFIFLPLAFNDQTSHLMLQIHSRAFLERTSFQGNVKAKQTKSRSSHEF